MISDRQLAANRRNAQLSTGPRTGAGLARSSRKAVRHGLDARSPVIPALEDPAAWDAHLAATLLGLARRSRTWSVPTSSGPLETALAERSAARRVSGRAESLRRETTLLAADKLDIVIRYETHLARQLDHTLAQLRQLQQSRPPAKLDSPPPARTGWAVLRKRTQPPPGSGDLGTTDSQPATTKSQPATAKSHPATTPVHPATTPVRLPAAQDAPGTPPAPSFGTR